MGLRAVQIRRGTKPIVFLNNYEQRLRAVQIRRGTKRSDR